MTERRPTTATVVFTDMVGSTALRVELGEERADELRRVHDDLLGDGVREQGGRVVKGGGDGLLAVFESASDALSAAVRMQQSCDAYNRSGDAIARLRIRIGISTGDVSWEGGDCFGLPVVEAARLEAAADGGQILCSELVRMLARGRGGHEFESMGFLELRGLAEPVAACEVVWRPSDEAITIPLPPALAVEFSTDLVGREPELAAAADILDTASTEPVRSIWLLGEPGIGKTRLAAEIGRTCHTAGLDVLFGRCDEDLGVPYQPFIEALRWQVSHVPDDELADVLGPGAAELTRLLPDLADRLAEPDRPAVGSSGIQQYRLFEAVREWLAAVARDRPLVVVLDDVHWATTPTLQLLSHLLRSAEPNGAVLIGTARNTEPDDSVRLGELLDELSGSSTGHLVAEVDGLTTEGVAQLVGEDRAHLVHGETAGNPLFVQALAGALDDDSLPRDVQAAARLRVGRLPEETQRLLRVASVAGLDVDLRVVAGAAGVSEMEALEAFENSAAARLVQEVGANRYRWTHALVRSALRSELSEGRRVRLHGRIAEAMEDVHREELDDHVAQLAHHYGEAVPVLGAVRALDYTRRAADRAARLLSHEEAARGYSRALELLEMTGAPSDEVQAELLLARGTEERRSGDVLAALSTLERGAEVAEQLPSSELLARIGIEFEDTCFWPGLDGRPAVAMLRRALGGLQEESALTAKATASLGRALRFAADFDAAQREVDRAIEMARRVGDRHVLAHAIARRLNATYGYRDIPAQIELAGELDELVDESDGELYLHAKNCASYFSSIVGDPGWNDTARNAFRRAAYESGEPFWVYTYLTEELTAVGTQGELDEAERITEEAFELGQGLRWIDASGIYGLRMFLIRREQGRLAEIAPLLQLVIRRAGDTPLWRPGLAALYAELDMLDECRTAYEELVADDFAAVPDDGTRELCFSFLADVCARLDDGERAPAIQAELRFVEPYVLFLGGSGFSLGAGSRYTAMMATTARRFDEAEVLFEQALGLNRSMAARGWTAQTLYQYARMLGMRSAPGDAARAGQHLAEAADLARQCGQAVLLERIADLGQVTAASD